MLDIMQRDINFVIFMNYFLFEKKNYLKRVTRVKKETFLSKSIYKLYNQKYSLKETNFINLSKKVN